MDTINIKINNKGSPWLVWEVSLLVRQVRSSSPTTKLAWLERAQNCSFH